MAAEDVLARALDAAGKRIRRLGDPSAARDATFTDNARVPDADAGNGAPGASLLAAPADHVHPSLAPTRIVARGTTTLAAKTRVTLANIVRKANEVFPPGGFAYVRDDVAGVSWENEVDGGTHIALYHERTAVPNELAFRATNVSDQARTVEWATIGLTPP